MANPVLVEVTRGDLVESIHRGAVAVVDGEGILRLGFGDIDSPVYTRSSLKPLQALPLIESGAADAFGLSDEEVALACASHSGEAMHTERVAAWLSRLGLSEADLACGPHRPRHESTSDFMVTTQKKPSRLHNNCSGKHAGFLTLAKHLKAPVSDYVALAHPVQQAVLTSLIRLSGITNPASGIDGCAAPNFALPLMSFARALAMLAAGKTPGAKRITAAMTAHPELVAGTGRFCTTVMQAAGKRAAVKVGAEGVYAAIVPELGLGVAVKIDDGAVRGAEAAIALLLEKLGILDAAKGLSLHPIHNTTGTIIGTVRPAPGLKALTL